MDEFFWNSPTEKGQGQIPSRSFIYNFLWNLSVISSCYLKFCYLVWFLRYLKKLRALSLSPLLKIEPKQFFRILWTIHRFSDFNLLLWHAFPPGDTMLYWGSARRLTGSVTDVGSPRQKQRRRWTEELIGMKLDNNYYSHVLLNNNCPGYSAYFSIRVTAEAIV